MQGFMGLRDVNHRKTHDTEHALRREHTASSEQLEKWAEEKTRTILRNHHDSAPLQDGDTTADSGSDRRGDVVFVEEFMSRNVVTLNFDDNLLTVRDIFSSVKFHHIPIVEAGRKIIGIISDRDMLRVVSPFFGTINEQTRDAAIMSRRVGTIMTRNPVCAHIGTTVADAIRLMEENNISCLPVVEEDGMRLLGIVTWKDLLRSRYPDAAANS